MTPRRELQAARPSAGTSPPAWRARLARLALLAALGSAAACGARSVHVLSPLEDGETVPHTATLSVKSGGRGDVKIECKEPAFAREIVVKYKGGTVDVSYTCAVRRPVVGSLTAAPALDPGVPAFPTSAGPRAAE